MESRRHHQRSRGRGPPRPPHHQQQQQPHHPRHRQNPNILISPAAAASYAYHQRHPMDEDAISTLMDIDDSPLGAAGAGFLDEEDGEGEMFLTPHRGGRGGGGEFRGPLPFSGFYNKFDGADFDDADLA
ncbi:unnamed protein product [Urochloa decumbens]|uniref:Uncharacterized protein n=1 Tax=Urochloa decumbens TaxID=240449 RepID=A0ABC9CGT8_9POAL